MLAPRSGRLCALLGLTLLCGASARADTITSSGTELARMLDSLDVEHRWQPGQPVLWRTGEVNPRGHQSATHCSAFVAAACERMGVYILRPPDHSQVLLANAQEEWLKSTGVHQGWKRVHSPDEAQRLANQGLIVVAAYRNPDAHKPGHIAIVRPSSKRAERIAEDGPQIIQAGLQNARSISLKHGFSHHPGAWEHGAIEFFAHAPGHS